MLTRLVLVPIRLDINMGWELKSMRTRPRQSLVMFLSELILVQDDQQMV